MALVNCPECEHQMSHTANVCPSCGFDVATFVNDDVEQRGALIFVWPFIIYFVVVLGGLHQGMLDPKHWFFNTSILDISVFNWLYLPLLALIGSLSNFKSLWYGGWNGAIMFTCFIILGVRYVAPELAPF